MWRRVACYVEEEDEWAPLPEGPHHSAVCKSSRRADTICFPLETDNIIPDNELFKSVIIIKLLTKIPAEISCNQRLSAQVLLIVDVVAREASTASPTLNSSVPQHHLSVHKKANKR